METDLTIGIRLSNLFSSPNLTLLTRDRVEGVLLGDFLRVFVVRADFGVITWFMER
jgi:hypothetical protein